MQRLSHKSLCDEPVPSQLDLADFLRTPSYSVIQDDSIEHITSCTISASRDTMLFIRPWSLTLMETDSRYQSHSGKRGKGVFTFKSSRDEGKVESFKQDCIEPSVFICITSVRSIVSRYFSCVSGETVG